MSWQLFLELDGGSLNIVFYYSKAALVLNQWR